MITLFIAIAVAFGGFSASYWGADLGMGWSAFLGVLSFIVFQLAFNFFIQRRVKAETRTPSRGSQRAMRSPSS